MPAIKVKPSARAQKRDFWGDADRGALFLEQFEKKFGDHFGSRKAALEQLHLHRRLFNMYVTGERAIPPEVWAKLRKLPNYKARAVVAAPALLYLDDVDPLS
jgi:hypothetical protein